jgi:hypothetical protein
VSATDPLGLTNAERKSLRERKSREAMSTTITPRKPSTITGNTCGRRGWLGRSWLVRCYTLPWGLPDDRPIDKVRFSTRITNALNAAGVKTVGEIRQASDATLRSFQDWSEFSRSSTCKFWSARGESNEHQIALTRVARNPPTPARGHTEAVFKIWREGGPALKVERSGGSASRSRSKIIQT